MRRSRGRVRNTVLFVVFILLLTAAAVLFVFSDPLYEMQRAAAIEEVLSVLDAGTNGVDIAMDAYPVHGEEDTSAPLTLDAALLGGESAAAETVMADDRAALELYGALAISRFDMRLPLYRTASTTALRFGAGVVTAGRDKTTVILGYRTRVEGRLLHDIDTLCVGDGVTLTRVDRVRTAYTVDAVRLMHRDALIKELDAPPDGCTLAIVSSQPAGEAEDRILVWLKPL